MCENFANEQTGTSNHHFQIFTLVWIFSTFAFMDAEVVATAECAGSNDRELWFVKLRGCWLCYNNAHFLPRHNFFGLRFLLCRRLKVVKRFNVLALHLLECIKSECTTSRVHEKLTPLFLQMCIKVVKHSRPQIAFGFTGSAVEPVLEQH